MNKKKLVALVMTVLMLLPSAAYAKGNSQKGEHGNQAGINQTNSKLNNNSDKNKDKEDQDNKDKKDNKGTEKKAANQANKNAKKQQHEAFKADMKAKHEIMKQLRLQTIAEKKLSETKIAQLQAIISDIEAGNKTLSQDMLTALLSKVANLKLDGEELKNTSDVTAEVSDTQEKIDNQDFNNALASMDKVIAKFQSRLDGLKQLNKDLDELLAIANLAAAPAASGDSTAPATSGDSVVPGTSGSTTTPSTGDGTTSEDSTTTAPVQNQSTTTGTSTQTTQTTSGSTN